uniref:Sb_13 protein n=1 Tax=Fopius arisanus TaxID=64838 RepID=A0A0C9Q9Y1_9HYME
MVTRQLLCLLILLVCSYRSFAEEDDDTISVEAPEFPVQERTASGRNIDWTQKSAPGGTCLMLQGEVGRCTTFKECYPYFKIPNLGSLDGWVLGVYDTCSYTREDGRIGFGVCCGGGPLTLPKPVAQGGPIVEEPQDVEDSNNKKDSPASWPPPVPTHPPHHTIPPLPTHPTLSSPGVITSRPVLVTTSRKPSATTWPTKKPAWWPGASTPKPLTTTSMMLSSSECGAKNGKQDQDRIVGGQNADPGEWPWIAALFNAGRQVCGGSLIDDKHILTAAHCVAHMNSWDVARLTVRLGDYNIKTSTEIQHVERRVKRVVRHKGFDPRTLYNDVAILTLNEPIEFSEMIRPICLPGGSQLYVGKTATVIGWGSLRESGPQPAVLQEVAIPVWPNSECKQKYGAAAPGGIVDSFLCAGRAAKDSCSV